MSQSVASAGGWTTEDELTEHVERYLEPMAHESVGKFFRSKMFTSEGVKKSLSSLTGADWDKPMPTSKGVKEYP